MNVECTGNSNHTSDLFMLHHVPNHKVTTICTYIHAQLETLLLYSILVSYAIFREDNGHCPSQVQTLCYRVD